MKIINKIPIPIAGLMLALAATGNLVLSYGEVYRNIFGVLSAVILFLLIIKVCTMPKSLLEGFENPVVAGVMPTFSMGLMILSTYIAHYFYTVAYYLWFVGLIIHFLLMFYFTKKYIFNFNIKKVFPTHFIVYVGIVCGSLTAPKFGLIGLGQFLFWIGFTSYLILLPLIIYRVVVIKGIPEPAIPTIAIFSAPASLCLNGYLISFQEKNVTMVAFLSILALVMYISVMVYIPKIMRLKFYPSFSALTFPFVITAIAMNNTYAFAIKKGMNFPLLFMFLTKFSELWAIVMVIYVLIRYTIFILKPDDRML
ncbi:MAG: TDT family transporter [Thermosediminibacteraceae bacterium]|nr:TDT family transporter [Thermosediminibacteraceae bacterium]